MDAQSLFMVMVYSVTSSTVCLLLLNKFLGFHQVSQVLSQSRDIHTGVAINSRLSISVNVSVDGLSRYGSVINWRLVQDVSLQSPFKRLTPGLLIPLIAGEVVIENGWIYILIGQLSKLF